MSIFVVQYSVFGPKSTHYLYRGRKAIRIRAAFPPLPLFIWYFSFRSKFYKRPVHLPLWSKNKLSVQISSLSGKPLEKPIFVFVLLFPSLSSSSSSSCSRSTSCGCCCCCYSRCERFLEMIKLYFRRRHLRSHTCTIRRTHTRTHTHVVGRNLNWWIKCRKTHTCNGI